MFKVSPSTSAVLGFLPFPHLPMSFRTRMDFQIICFLFFCMSVDIMYFLDLNILSNIRMTHFIRMYLDTLFLLVGILLGIWHYL